ncbi:MAG: tRNA lysidine(34) synthetase TilS [Coriobacteriaceae bacterium]|nr:tRNA lysidine(34) synthetase TilS [Coriobacteriaceae bacterium]
MNKDIEILAVVKQTLETRGMFPEGSPVPVVLMVSGGSDSLALSHILPIIRPLEHYTILHINHGLRGKEADADEQFVADFAQMHDMALEVVRLDVAAIAAQTGENIEQCGRNQRYKAAAELLDRLCEQEGVSPDCGRIAVAHTLDDSVETFFMRAIIGGGAAGLSSIPYINSRVIRPLLDCTREGLRKYLVDLCQQRSLGEPETNDRLWCEDASNYDTQGFRAFVRHELMPLAATRNPRLLETMGRNLQIIAEEDAYLDMLVKKIEAEAVTRYQDGTVKLATAILEQPKPLARRIVRSVCNQVLPVGERITFSHVSLITDQGQRVGFVTTLPGNVTVKNECDTLTFLPEAVRIARENAVAEQVSQKRELSSGKRCMLPDGSVLTLTELTSADFGNSALAFVRKHSRSECVYVDGNELEEALRVGDGCLAVTGIRTGDVFCPLGMRGKHKLVSDVLIDRKIPACERPNIRVIRSEQRIIWIVGVQLDDRFKVTEQSNTMFCIELTKPMKG